MRFAAKRAGEHVGRLSLVALVAALVVVGIGGIDAVAERSMADGAARMLADAEPAARSIRVVAAGASDPGAQDTEVRAAISTAFAGIDVDVTRRSGLEAAAETTNGTAFALRLLDDERIPELAVLTDGEWPQSPDQIALPAPAAERQQLGIGDTVALVRDGTPFILVGTWAAEDPEDAAWVGDPAVVSGESDGAIGPAVVARGALNGLTSAPTATWEIAPVGAQPGDLVALQRAVTRLRDLPDVIDPQRQHNTRVLGGLGDTLQRQSAAVAATRGLLVAPLLIIALLGALVLGAVLATLSTVRREELVLLRARGASGRRLALGAAGEATVFAAAGAALALAGLAVATGVTPSALLTAAGTVAFSGVAAGFLAVRTASRADVVRTETLRSDAGARPPMMLLLVAGVVAGLAALSAWQLFATGTVVRADGTPEPLAAAAPALLLVAVCLLGPVGIGPLAALAERLVRRTRGITPILPVRQIARRMGSVAVAILCLALAAASMALAVAAPAAADAAEQRTRTALLGGDVRMITEDGLDAVAGAAATWSGVTDTAEVLRTPLTVGSDTAILVAGPPEALGFADPIPAGADGTVAAEITQSLADRLGAAPGTVFTARVRSVARPVSIEVVRIVEALPGVGDGLGVAADPEELRTAGADLPANELWLRSDAPEETAAQLRAQATQPVRILTAAQVSAAPVVSVAPALLTTGALVASGLGVIGFLAASSAATRARRDERLVLRALGLGLSHQRMLRAGEIVSVAVYAVLVGAVLGAGVAAAVLPIVLGLGA
ncbi:hypothetical protein [Microbacterium abyssi]|uniref:hypothetical protein n=1 Tax=Microbacterium abyssi TaxID=2782166 RepID=UPI0018890B48|nr:hypothetical protein [Microbacterium sp. A18JL241]